MKVKQTSKKMTDNRWKWSISLDATPEKLDTVKKVVYHLHPTFPNPVVEKTNRKANFKLSTSGWGTFVVRVEIHYKDGRVEELRHRLTFKHDTPKVFLSYPSSESDSDVVRDVKNKAKDLGWEISTADTLSPNDDLESVLNAQIDEAQLFVLVGGDTPSRFAMNEMKVAEQLGKKTIILDKSNIYQTTGSETVKNSEELLNAFKGYNFKLKGLG